MPLPRLALVLLIWFVATGTLRAESYEADRRQLVAGLALCADAIRGQGPDAFADLQVLSQNGTGDAFRKGSWMTRDGKWEIALKASKRRPAPNCSVKRSGSGSPETVDRVLIKFLDEIEELEIGGAKFSVLIDKQGAIGRVRVFHTCDLLETSIMLIPDFAQSAGRVRFSMGGNLFKKDAC